MAKIKIINLLLDIFFFQLKYILKIVKFKYFSFLFFLTIFVIKYKLIKMINEINLNDLLSYVRNKIHFDKDKIGGNFILTDDANKRLEKVDHLMKSKISIMLLGPTGTFKTKTIL